jgi:phosphoglycerate kinase
MGYFEDPRYRAGSLAIAEAIVGGKAFSVVGGGETTQFILESKMEHKFGFLSTGGGAMLAYLSGKKLPGLEALEG